MTKRVRDLMHSGLVACAPGTTLGQAAGLLVGRRIHALVVVGEAGEPLGVVSDIDLLAGEWLSTDAASLETMRAMPVGQLMNAPVTIEADAPAAEAAARLRRERLQRLCVTDGGRLVGVVSISDLVAHLGEPSPGRGNVAEVMSRGLTACRQDTPLPAAARAMTERRSRSLVVVDARGRPLGVVTGLDLLAAWDSGETTATVAQVMHPPLAIGPQASLRQAADQMLTHHVHRLVVMDPAEPDGFPLGLISTSDIMAAMAAPGSVWQTGT